MTKLETIDAPGTADANALPAWHGDRCCEAAVMKALRQVVDADLGLSMLDLGLVSDIRVQGQSVQVALTMTPAGCELLDDAGQLLRAALPPGWQVDVTLQLQPPWSPRRMSELARRRLGW
jgi:metal-sulfur cluster biosynthetic enzyme